MDIVAHGLWAGIGVSAASRYWAIDRKTAIATVLAAMVPDVIQLLPFVGRVLFDADGVKVLTAYVTALPGMEPALPPAVASLTHHLHCIMHSAVVAGVVTALYWIVMRSLWLPPAWLVVAHRHRRSHTRQTSTLCPCSTLHRARI